MKKRIVAILIIALMLIALIPSTAFAATSGKWGSNIKWEFSGRTLIISGKGAMVAPDENNIPPWFAVDGLRQIVIKEGVTTLPDFIFMGARSEEGGIYGTAQVWRISISASVKEISPYAFIDCCRLREIEVDPANEYYSGNDGILYNKDQTELLWVPNGTGNWFTIPKTVERIYVDSILTHPVLTSFALEEGNNVFETDDNGNLYDKTTNTLVMVGKKAYGTHKVKEGTKAIVAVAFYSCKEIWEIDIPEGVSVIEPLSFYDCQSLRTIWLPSTITSIGEYAFGECANLTDVYFNGTKEMWDKIAIAEGNECLLDANIHLFCSEHLNFVELVPATCTEPQHLKCSECRYTVTGDPPLGHCENLTIIPAREATCVETGYTQGKRCDRCNQIIEGADFLNIIDHDKVSIPAVEPTCTEQGFTEGVVCSFCGRVFEGHDVIHATGHQGEWVITKEATQTENGIKTFTCTVCGEVETVEYSLYKKGDANNDGSVDAKDATQILRYVNGKASALDSMDEAERLAIGDVSRDDSIDAKDATQILRYVNGKTSMFDRSEQ